MIEVEYLDLDDAVEIIRTLRVGPVRDIGLLESAMHRPRAGAFGEDAYPTIELKAAALLHSLTKNHALVDGNKRLAWLCTVVFCDLNNRRSDLSDDAAFTLVWEVAGSDIELGEIAARLSLTA
ncbi:MAG TPA: Fic family protein [Acidimicrobiales bacterium]|nr:Fic family protein [Acidimicrobiales bacterium]